MIIIMKTAILIHGWPDKDRYFNLETPSPSNAQWFPWLQKQLLLNDIVAQAPEMPDAWEPEYEKWKTTFEQFAVDEQTVLVGHSCGAGFIVRWLSENRITAGKVILVAPWIDPLDEKELDNGFFNFVIDPSIVSRVKSIDILYSTDDDLPMIESVKILQKVLPSSVMHEFHDKGHFDVIDMVDGKFPELIEIILK